ncbi:MAG: molybdenum cofactor sulfurase, partial [Halieaceae bacterium]|nr:molybdenum cofactor sulfurase [Halieaceae bacterium]
MKTIIGRVASVYVGSIEGDLAKQPCASLTAELDGFVGDRHRSISRQTWAGDKQAEGTQRRNERHWSAVSVEELAAIEQHMDLNEPLKAADLGANLCIEGVPQLSLLAMGTILKFSSGAELMVEEYNPPCLEMSKKLASLYTSSSGGAIANNAFSKAAKYSRGLVGVVEGAGLI